MKRLRALREAYYYTKAARRLGRLPVIDVLAYADNAGSSVNRLFWEWGKNHDPLIMQEITREVAVLVACSDRLAAAG